ncbi:hypothetical protein C370_07298 [Cryptococcus neoformans A1-35-8]|nr:hypothetical protein C370_07298 [Cryptococcus neoformans var. grubii A1-35-8]
MVDRISRSLAPLYATTPMIPTYHWSS